MRTRAKTWPLDWAPNSSRKLNYTATAGLTKLLSLTKHYYRVCWWLNRATALDHNNMDRTGVGAFPRLLIPFAICSWFIPVSAMSMSSSRGCRGGMAKLRGLPGFGDRGSTRTGNGNTVQQNKTPTNTGWKGSPSRSLDWTLVDCYSY